MNKFRKSRINEAAKEALGESIRTVKDPRVSQALVTVTSVEVTGDLRFAKVYVSALSGDPGEVEKGLQSAAGYLRGQMAEKLNLRMTPELKFFLDESAQKGARIATILKNLERKDDDENDRSDP